MITLIKKAEVYAPEYLGCKDVLLIEDKIGAVEDHISIAFGNALEVNILQGSGQILTPGFVDSHVHIIGGGGEGGFKTRTPEIRLSELTRGGTTTVVGCLGLDGVTRCLTSLLAKAKGLTEEGITALMYSGSYHVPIITLTGDITRDMVLVDEVIGAGEIAISDHRSSQPTLEELKRLAADTRVGGMLSGKAGILNVHLGDGKGMLEPLFRIVRETEIPFTQFLPTHINRNPYLFEDGIRYAKAGGYIDFTTSSDPAFWVGPNAEIKASKALRIALEQGVSEEHLSFSSDAQGSLPVFNEKNEVVGLGIGKAASLFQEVRDAVLQEGVSLEKALKVITSNPAARLALKAKGHIRKGYDADLCLLDKNTLAINTVMAKGKIMVRDGEIKVYGIFENLSV